MIGSRFRKGRLLTDRKSIRRIAFFPETHDDKVEETKDGTITELDFSTAMEISKEGRNLMIRMGLDYFKENPNDHQWNSRSGDAVIFMSRNLDNSIVAIDAKTLRVQIIVARG